MPLSNSEQLNSFQSRKNDDIKSETSIMDLSSDSDDYSDLESITKITKQDDNEEFNTHPVCQIA